MKCAGSSQLFVDIILDRVQHPSFMDALKTFVKDTVKVELAIREDADVNIESSMVPSGTPVESLVHEHQDNKISTKESVDVFGKLPEHQDKKLSMKDRCGSAIINPTSKVLKFAVKREVFAKKRSNNVSSSGHLVVDNRGDKRDEGGGIGNEMVPGQRQELTADGCFVGGCQD